MQNVWRKGFQCHGCIIKDGTKHHFEYWIDYSIDKDHPGLVGMKIPKKYMAEMFVDRVSAGKIYNGG